MAKKKQAVLACYGSFDLSQTAKDMLKQYNIDDFESSLAFRSHPLVIHCAKKLGRKFLIRCHVGLVNYDIDKFKRMNCRGCECIELSDGHVYAKPENILYGEDNIEGIATQLFEKNKKIFERLAIT